MGKCNTKTRLCVERGVWLLFGAPDVGSAVLGSNPAPSSAEDPVINSDMRKNSNIKVGEVRLYLRDVDENGNHKSSADAADFLFVENSISPFLTGIFHIPRDITKRMFRTIGQNFNKVSICM